MRITSSKKLGRSAKVHGVRVGLRADALWSRVHQVEFARVFEDFGYA